MNQIHRNLLVGLLVVLTLGAGPAEATGESEVGEKIDALISEYAELRQFNGSALVAEGGRVVLERGYGLANMEWDLPNSPETKFRLGSITKQFTAMLVLQLVDDGKLRLESTVAELLPYYRTDTGERITVHHLLRHTSGLPNYTSQPGFGEVIRDPFDVETFTREHCSGDLEFEPGSRFRYSNSGYFVLGAILEQVSGESYEDLLRERILDPLEMSSSGYDHTGPLLARRASGYERTPDGFRNADYLDMSLPYAAGSLYSTVRDLRRWDRALDDGVLVSAKLQEQMLTPGESDYAYGWVVRKRPVGPDEAERKIVGHGGGINGFNTVIERIPEDRHLIVLLNNTGGAPLQQMTSGIFDILYGRTPELPKPSIVEPLLEKIETSGVDAAVAFYRELAKNEPDAYRFDEGELNNLGYALLGRGDSEGAIAVFRLNVEIYPESSNPYDSLGEALAEAGRTEEAIRNYAKSLELDPRNRNAVEALSRLVSN